MTSPTVGLADVALTAIVAKSDESKMRDTDAMKEPLIEGEILAHDSPKRRHHHHHHHGSHMERGRRSCSASPDRALLSTDGRNATNGHPGRRSSTPSPRRTLEDHSNLKRTTSQRSHRSPHRTPSIRSNRSAGHHRSPQRHGSSRRSTLSARSPRTSPRGSPKRAKPFGLNDDPPYRGKWPYMSRGLQRAYKNKSGWKFEVFIGSLMIITGLICIVVDYARDWTLEVNKIGIGITIVGALFILLGLLWYKNGVVRAEEAKRQAKLRKKYSHQHDRADEAQDADATELDVETLVGSRSTQQTHLLPQEV